MLGKKIKLRRINEYEILIVDDNPVNQELVARQVERLNFASRTVSSGREALQVLQQGRYAFVLMDIRMPDMDGHQTSRLIRRLPGPASKIPIIAISAYGRFEDRQKAEAAGINDFVFKPIELETLKKILAKWWPHKIIRQKRSIHFRLEE